MENDFPMCPECGEQLNEPPDDERVAVEWCSSCGQRCIITRKAVIVYEIEAND